MNSTQSIENTLRRLHKEIEPLRGVKLTDFAIKNAHYVAESALYTAIHKFSILNDMKQAREEEEK